MACKTLPLWIHVVQNLPLWIHVVQNIAPLDTRGAKFTPLDTWRAKFCPFGYMWYKIFPLWDRLCKAATQERLHCTMNRSQFVTTGQILLYRQKQNFMLWKEYKTDYTDVLTDGTELISLQLLSCANTIYIYIYIYIWQDSDICVWSAQLIEGSYSDPKWCSVRQYTEQVSTVCNDNIHD
jgi:hypothetical protein